jgi:ribosomal S20-like protein
VVVAISALDRAVAKGVLHRSNAARRKARLMRQFNAEAPAAAPAAPPPPAAPAKGTGRASRTKAPSRKR